MSHQSFLLAKPKHKPEEQAAVDAALRGPPQRAQSRVEEVQSGSGGKTEHGQLTRLHLSSLGSRTQPWSPTSETSLGLTSSHSAPFLGFRNSTHSESTTNTLCEAMLYNLRHKDIRGNNMPFCWGKLCCVRRVFLTVWNYLNWKWFEEGVMCVLYPPWLPPSITKFNFQVNQRRLSFNEWCYSFLLIDALRLEKLMIWVGFLMTFGFPEMFHNWFTSWKRTIYRVGKIDENILSFFFCHPFFFNENH